MLTSSWTHGLTHALTPPWPALSHIHLLRAHTTATPRAPGGSRELSPHSTSLLLRCQLPSGSTQALQPEDPNSLGSLAQARPLRRGATSHGPQQMFNNQAFTWKWKQVNLYNFIRTVLELRKTFQSFINSCWAHTGIWIHVRIPGLFTKSIIKKSGFSFLFLRNGHTNMIKIKSVCHSKCIIEDFHFVARTHILTNSISLSPTHLQHQLSFYRE